MNHNEVIENISNQFKICNLALSQSQDIVRNISLSMCKFPNAISPIVLQIAQPYNSLKKIIDQISPTLNSVQQVMSRFNLPSLLSQIKDLSNIPQRILDLNINTDAFTDTIFESGTETISESVCEKILSDSAIVAENIIQQNNKNPIQKKSALKKFFKFISNLFSVVVFPVILFFLAPYWQSCYEEQIQPKTYYNEFLELQDKNNELTLRLVTKNTCLYLGKKMKHVVGYVEKYDVVEVLEDNGKIIKVRIFDSNEVGWMYKKYTKK